MTSRRFSRHDQLEKASRNAPSLKSGASGDGVGELQSVLADMGFDLKRSLGKGRPDGIYGQETENAVKGFQRKQGLVADGIAGRVTITALDEIIASNAMLEAPSDASEKADLARSLASPISRSKSAYW